MKYAGLSAPLPPTTLLSKTEGDDRDDDDNDGVNRGDDSGSDVFERVAKRV